MPLNLFLKGQGMRGVEGGQRLKGMIGG